MDDKDFLKPEDEDFSLDMEGLAANKAFLKEQRELGNPSYQYKGNCTKAYAEKIASQHIEREWKWVKSNSMPSVFEHEPKESMYENEIKTLVKEQKSWKTRSLLIKKFHLSALDASKSGRLSPNAGWKKIQDDKEEFKKFYLNRLRCSDWFNEFKKSTESYDAHWRFLLDGYVPPFIYAIGLTTSGRYLNVGMFKPHAARYLVSKYLSEFNEVFDPFSGFSGRLLGTVALGKKYVGRDLSKRVVEESKELMDYASPVFKKHGVYPKYDLDVADAITSIGSHECLLTCSPYGDIEKWDGVPETNKSCDEWIDICLKNYECQRYVFVTDGNIKKHKAFAKETFTNNCHWGKNDELVVVIDKTDRDEALNAN